MFTPCLCRRMDVRSNGKFKEFDSDLIKSLTCRMVYAVVKQIANTWIIIAGGVPRTINSGEMGFKRQVFGARPVSDQGNAIKFREFLSVNRLNLLLSQVSQTYILWHSVHIPALDFVWGRPCPGFLIRPLLGTNTHWDNVGRRPQCIQTFIPENQNIRSFYLDPWMNKFALLHRACQDFAPLSSKLLRPWKVLPHIWHAPTFNRTVVRQYSWCIIPSGPEWVQVEETRWYHGRHKMVRMRIVQLQNIVLRR